jgi:hypothetical protein
MPIAVDHKPMELQWLPIQQPLRYIRRFLGHELTKSDAAELFRVHW